MSDRNLNLYVNSFYGFFSPQIFKKSTYKITTRDMNQILWSNGYPKKDSKFLNPITSSLSGAFDSIEEFTFFLTHLIYESRGLNYTKDPRVSQEDIDNCKYNNEYGIKGVSYHGRGWFLITWPENYIEVSNGTGLGNLLYTDPEFLVKPRESPILNLNAAIWWWKNKIVCDDQVQPNNFGFTTDRMWELHRREEEGWDDKRKRYYLYRRICEIFNVRRPADF